MTIEERNMSPEITEDWIRACLREGESAELTVMGSCMKPALIEGDKVTLSDLLRPVRIGDIVLIRTPAGLRLHRVLIRHGETVRTKGDHGIYLDPPTPRSRVVARCLVAEPLGTRALRTFLSLLRLGQRAWPRRPAGDEAHARLLP